MDKKISTFYLDRFWFGIEADHVQEVVRYQDITPVPLAPAAIRGLINVRGKLLTALDLRRRLGLPERPANKLPVNLVIYSGDEAVSLLVDDIGDVVEVGDPMFEEPPSTLSGPAHEIIRGTYKLRDELLLLLDSETATAPTQSDTAHETQP
jgi:purine-binding chemotaxis protein CheW